MRELRDGREHTGEKKGHILQQPFAKLLETDQPDVAIVFVGVNDAGWRQTEPAEFRHELAAIADEAAARKVKLVLVTPAVDGERPDGSNEHDERMDLLASRVRQVAAEKKAVLVDLRKVFLARLRNENSAIKLDGRFEVPQVNGWLTVDGILRGKMPWGTVTLLQLLRAAPGGLSLPKLVIQDEPTLPMRAISVDVARMPHSIEGLTQVVDLCRLYKLNYLHLHLTDDGAFLFPSRRFPRLPSASAGECRPPYSREELDSLERYAAERGVFLMPEIEAPGHAPLMLRAMPELFKISLPATPDVGYEPSSAINIAKPEVRKALCALWDEVCQVFASTPYVHAGCDEADFTPWCHLNPEFRLAFERYGFRRENPAENVHLVYSRYIADLRNHLAKRGKKMLVWENEAVIPSREVEVPKDILVQPFDSYNPKVFTGAGLCLVNAAWTPLYIVNTATNHPEEPWRPQERYAHALPFLWQWSVEKFGTRGPGIEGFDYRRVPSDKVKGAQLTTWEQAEHAEVSTLRRRAAIASPHFSPKGDLSWDD